MLLLAQLKQNNRENKMRDFYETIHDIYLPAYVALYDIKRRDGKDDAFNVMLYQAQFILKLDDTPFGFAIREKSRTCVGLLSRKTITRLDIDKSLFDILYALRAELKSYCVYYGNISKSQELKLINHYTW